MPLTPPAPTDTRFLFRPVSASLVTLLRSLPAGAWLESAVGTWQVRDVVAHLIDVTMRRLSFHRDRHAPPPPPFPVQNDRDFTRFINQINADWVGAARRLSTRQLADLYASSSGELADFVEALPFDAPGLFGVSWAGEMESAGWFDIGREFTEQWHHQAQIREATGSPALVDPAWLHATLAIALRGLPHAYRGHQAIDGTTLTIEITGEAGGTWTLERANGSWRLMQGEPDAATARATTTDNAAWRLLFNRLSDEAASAAMRVTGDAVLAAPLVKARSIVVSIALLLTATFGMAGCGRSAPPPPSPATFTKDIAPIVFANCASCHRPGGVAPFSLLTYADAARNADEIAHQTLSSHMPPWQPERGEFPILGERRLRPDQIDAIQRWVKGGRVEGNPADLPAAPVFTDGWQFGRPDAVLTVPRPYVVSPGVEDVYRNLVYRTPFTSEVFVRAVEFKTGGTPIHHAVIRVDPTSASRRRDADDAAPGFDGMAWHTVQDPDGQFVGWAPGRGPIASPDGMPWRLQRGADLVVEMHVIPGEAPIELQPEVGLFLTGTPPVHTPLTVRMGSKIIDIPAGKRDYVVTDTYELPVPVDLLSVYPHAHYLGAEMRVTATLPDGAVKSLLHIHDWSFHWQQDYRYVTPIPLPRGTRLTMQYTFDNSEDNPDNPSRPPVRVRAGPKSTDEMAELGLQLLPKSPQDAAWIAREFDERERLANVALAESRVREEPRVAEYRALLGGSYVEAGRHADAIPHLETAIRLGERSAAVHNYLGVALMAQGRVADALVSLRRAAALDPRDERLPFNVGNALGRLSRPAEAAAAYKRSLVINPDFLDAHVNLAVLLSAHGRTKEALAHYARAVALRPDSAVIHSNYGGALAAAGQYADAMRHVRRALEIEPGYPPALDNFRRLQRMGIR